MLFTAGKRSREHLKMDPTTTGGARRESRSQCARRSRTADSAPLLRLDRQGRRASRLPGVGEFSAARYATVCEETPLPWPRGAPFERARVASARPGGGARPGAFFPFGYEEAKADEIDLCLRWAEASAPPPAGGAYPAVPALVLQGGEDLRTPPAGSARVAAALGAQRVVVPGVGHAVVGGDPSRCGIRRLFAFLRGRPASAACPRVPTEVPAIGVPPTVAEPAGRRRAACPGERGGRWRRSTSRSTTSPSRSRRRSARR